jgi:hypothetical protein
MLQILPFRHSLKSIVRKRLALTSLVVSLLLCTLAIPCRVRAGRPLTQAPAAETPSIQAVTSLEQGKPVARELSGGQKHGYQITVAADQYARVTVKQHGMMYWSGVGPDGKRP